MDNNNFEIVVPSPGESVTEAQVGRWLKEDGERVEKDDEILEVESEKASLVVPAPESGILRISAKAGETLAVGSVLGSVEIAGTVSPTWREEAVRPEPAEPSGGKGKADGKSEVFEVRAPSPGESVNEVVVSAWSAEDGSWVDKDQEIGELESEKASLPIIAEKSGRLKIAVRAGSTVSKDQLIAEIETEGNDGEVSVAPPLSKGNGSDGGNRNLASPAAAKILREAEIAEASVQGTGKQGRITKEDALKAVKVRKETLPEKSPAVAPPPAEKPPANVLRESGPSLPDDGRRTTREKMSPLRKKISERLVSVKNHAAMLTTFNEVDMSGVIATRNRYKEIFKEKHSVGLGFMSFFSKACSMALREFPPVNSQIEGDEIVRFDYVDLGIAVSAPKGLMVPVLRNAESMGLAEIEAGIRRLSGKAREGRLSLEEMRGGTFTITNGGVFGSMLSTPIINPPQSAILGMHNIVQRPVAVQGKVEVRPVMFVALSYDHRIIDGKDSVGFLYRVKELLEDPVRMLIQA